MKIINLFCVIGLCFTFNINGMYRVTIIKKSASSISESLAKIALAIESLAKEQEKIRILQEKMVLISEIQLYRESLENKSIYFDIEKQIAVRRKIDELIKKLNK